MSRRALGWAASQEIVAITQAVSESPGKPDSASWTGRVSYPAGKPSVVRPRHL